MPKTAKSRYVYVVRDSAGKEIARCDGLTDAKGTTLDDGATIRTLQRTGIEYRRDHGSWRLLKRPSYLTVR